MRKRIRKKIVKRFLALDEALGIMFVMGWQRHRPQIQALRSAIQYWRRRYPHLYREAFGIPLSLGHLGSGR